MKITIKTLKQEELTVEVDPSGTISDIKQKVFEKYGHPVNLQKLIFTGKILVDDTAIATHNIKETDFLVLMVTKAPIAKQEPPKPAPVAQQPAPVAQQPAPVVQQPAPVAQQPAPVAQQPAPVVQQPAPKASVPEELVNQIVEMGFDPSDVRAALQASFNNPDRAVEYLMNGYPPGVGPNQPAPQPSVPSVPSVPSGQNPQSPAVSGNLFQMAAQAAEQRQNESSPFDALRNQPNINNLRQLVQQNPQLLQPLLQQLAQTNPQILQLIQQNYQEFIRFISEPVSGESGAGGGAPVIQVTQEEKEAIEQLEALGFPRSRVLEAFIACDRDSTAAANYLFENAGDDAGSFQVDEDDDEEWEDGSFN